MAHGVSGARGLDLVDDLLELEGQVLGEQAGFLPGEDASEVILGCEWAMGIVSASGRNCETLVEIGDEFGQVGIACFGGRDIA